MKRIALLFLVGILGEMLAVVFVFFALIALCACTPAQQDPNHRVITDRAEWAAYVAEHKCMKRVGWKCTEPVIEYWVEVTEQ